MYPFAGEARIQILSLAPGPQGGGPARSRRVLHGSMSPKPYEFIGFGGIHGPKPYEFIGFGGVAYPSYQAIPVYFWFLGFLLWFVLGPGASGRSPEAPGRPTEGLPGAPDPPGPGSKNQQKQT